MRFITIFRSADASSGPPSAKHRQRMQDEIGKAVAASAMVTTGGIGLRASTGGRVTRASGKITVEAPPQDDGGWMAAGGFSIVEAASRDDMIARITEQLEFMGDGTAEFVEYKQFFPQPGVQLQGAEAPARGLTAGVIPYLNVVGASEAGAFYKKAFGAIEHMRMPSDDGKKLMHLHLEINGGSLMVADCFPEYGYPHQPSHSFTMQLVLQSDIEGWWKRAVDAGCTVRQELGVAFWGDMFGAVVDPYGVSWAMSQPVKKA